jgi:N-dimethylarginine dimethylaminohydrolase
MMTQSEHGLLKRVLLKHPRDAFRDPARIAREWRALNFTAPPDLAKATAEYEAFTDAIRRSGARVDFIRDGETGLDSIYVRDASIVCDAGVILCRMGKLQREQEPAAQEALFRSLGVRVLGAIEPPGRLEGGDVAWLDRRTLAVGRGYRTNDHGIAQLRRFLGPEIEVIVVPLPHWRGPGDVFHLMSILSPIDADLALVYSRLMPVPFRELLLDRGFTLLDVPDSEFDSMGTNVLAVAPRRCLMLAGNPRTRALLEAAGAEVIEYVGDEISLKGGGGPTCLTRPLARA